MQVSLSARALLHALALALAAAPAGAQIVQVLDASGDGAGNPLGMPGPLAVDAAGNLYATSGVPATVFRIAPGGAVDVLLDATGAGQGDQVSGIADLALDAAGNLYVASQYTAHAYRVEPDGAVSLIYDDAQGGLGTGNLVRDLAVDSAGNVYLATSTLFLANPRLVRVTPAGVASVLLDQTGDGQGNVLGDPSAVVVDAADNVYVAGKGSWNVFRVAPDGSVAVVLDAAGDGAANPLRYPSDLVLDPSGNLFVAAGIPLFGAPPLVFRVAPGGSVDVVADATGDGVGAALESADGLAADQAGNVYVRSLPGHSAFKISHTGPVTRIIDATGDGMGNPLTLADGIAADAAGHVYVSGRDSDNVFRVGPLASCTFRNGSGANPADYICVTEPLLGSSWETAIDPTPSVGDAVLGTVVVLGHGGATQGLFAPEGELLVLPPYRYFPDLTGAVGQHEIPIPADPAYAGLQLHSQGVRLEVVDGVLPVAVMLNAQDPRLGF